MHLICAAVSVLSQKVNVSLKELSLLRVSLLISFSFEFFPRKMKMFPYYFPSVDVCVGKVKKTNVGDLKIWFQNAENKTKKVISYVTSYTLWSSVFGSAPRRRFDFNTSNTPTLFVNKPINFPFPDWKIGDTLILGNRKRSKRRKGEAKLSVSRSFLVVLQGERDIKSWSSSRPTKPTYTFLSIFGWLVFVDSLSQ